MANKFKKFFAMVLALCMLVIISPLQALAETSVYPDDINADLNVDQTNGTIDIVFTPVDGAEGEGGDLEWESDLTLGDNVETELKDLTVTEEETEEGGTIVTESATVGSEGTLENGETVTGSETHVETTITEENGTVTTTDVTDGSETIEWSGEGAENIEGLENIEGIENLEGLEDLELPEVEVELKPGETTESETVTDSVSGPVGDVSEGEGDTEYDYTNVTVVIDRTVSAESSELEVTPPDVTNNYESPIDPTTDLDKHWDTSPQTKEDPQRNGLFGASPNLYDLEDVLKFERWEEGEEIPEGYYVGNLVYQDLVNKKNPILAEEPKDVPEGYDFFYSGMGEYTDAAAAVFKYIVYERNEDGSIKYDENNQPIVDEEKSYLMNGFNGKAPNSGMDYQAGQLAMTNVVYDRYEEGDEIPEGCKVGDIKYDEDGKPVWTEGDNFYAYCADFLVEADAEAGHWYKMENLEDSGHYTEEDAQKLRAIVLNGYWGDAETGTLEQIKANLTEYAKTLPNGTVTVKDKNGNDREFDLVTLLGEMKEHEALAVTQAAVWAYSVNRTNTAYMDGKLPEGVDAVEILGAQSAIKCYAYNSSTGKVSWYTEYKPAINQDDMPLDGAYVKVPEDVRAAREEEALRSDARMAALFDYLMNLQGIPDTNKDVTTVINENNFIAEDSLSLVVHDRVEEHVNNQDENHDNDVYNTDLKFSLAFVPGANDELLVYLYGIGDEPIVRRISGTENDDIEYITKEVGEDGNEVYVFTGLQLGENEETKFDLRLDGVHHLNNGVYLYTAEGGRLASQTFVGIAGGSQEIDITASMTIKFDVDENHHVVAERYWHSESDPVTEPETPDNPPYDPPVPYEIPPRSEEPRPQVRYRLARNVGQLETIIDEEVPLAEVPQTGDISVVWFAMVLVAGMGLCMLKLSERKCRA